MTARLLIAMSALLAACSPPPKPVGPDLTDAEKSAIRATVGDQLLDGASTQWRWYPWPKQSIETRSGTYCGWLNTKNSFGAYTGLKLYNVDIVKSPAGGSVVERLRFVEKYDRSDGVRDSCIYGGFDVNAVPAAEQATKP